MSTEHLYDKEYYEEHPEYSEVPCFKCKKKTMRCIGIVTNDDIDISDKTLYQCEKCGQEAYIDIEWIFTISIPMEENDLPELEEIGKDKE